MDWHDALVSYTAWLDTQPLSENTKRAYLSRVRQFIAYANDDCLFDEFLASPEVQKESVEAYRQHLLAVAESTSASVNNKLTAVDHLFQSLDLPRPRIQREQWLQKQPPLILTLEQEDKLVDACTTRSGARDRCIVFLQLFAGLRLTECANLDVTDVSANGQTLLIRTTAHPSKSACPRTVALGTRASLATSEWLKERSQQSNRGESAALFVSSCGNRLSAAGIDYIIRRLGWKEHLVLSSQVLRNTCLRHRLQSGEDLCRLAEMAGLSRVDSLLRYAATNTETAV